MPVVQVDLALERAVGEMEDAGLPADADELDDVGKVKLSERALEGHKLTARDRRLSRSRAACQGQAGVGFAALLLDLLRGLTARRSRRGQQDVVALDHLVEGGGLQPQQPGRLLLHAARRVEGGLDEPPLEARDHVPEADALRRHASCGGRGSWARRARGRGSGRGRSAPSVVSTTPRSMTFSSSRTLPGQS